MRLAIPAQSPAAPKASSNGSLYVVGENGRGVSSNPEECSLPDREQTRKAKQQLQCEGCNRKDHRQPQDMHHIFLRVNYRHEDEEREHRDAGGPQITGRKFRR